MNNVILMGRLATEPTLQTTPNNKHVCSFTLAVPRRFAKDQTDFIRCQAWKKTAEFISKYFDKGRMIAVTGQLRIEHWEDNGKKKSAAQVVVDSAYFTGEKVEQQSGGGYPYKGGNSPAGYQKPEQMKIDEFGLEDVSEDDLPF